MKLKRISSCFLISVFLLGGAVVCQTDAVCATSTTTLTSIILGDEISPRAESTEWKYRYVDGKLQKRLWSISEKKWLTDWKWA